MLKDAIKEVGEANVVQIVTDNGSAFVKEGKLLLKKYNMYWTACAAHCIDLMFEDIGKRDSVAQLIIIINGCLQKCERSMVEISYVLKQQDL